MNQTNYSVLHSVCFIKATYFNFSNKVRFGAIIQNKSCDCDLCWYLTILIFYMYSLVLFLSVHYLSMCISIHQSELCKLCGLCMYVHVRDAYRYSMHACRCTLKNPFFLSYILFLIEWKRQKVQQVYDTITTSMLDFIFHSAIRPIYWWNSYWVLRRLTFSECSCTGVFVDIYSRASGWESEREWKSVSREKTARFLSWIFEPCVSIFDSHHIRHWYFFLLLLFNFFVKRFPAFSPAIIGTDRKSKRMWLKHRRKSVCFFLFF